jgi:2',3'-cyclic-nucleotide 2'-phosphodiesterase (5'-nucleotidase family)
LSNRWPSCEQSVTVQTISFVHVSDTHAHYNPDPEGSSPLARIRGFADQIRQKNPYTIFTNGGDDYEKGSLAEELSRGQTTRQVIRAMQYDLRTLGNHDFAWGLDELLRSSQDSHGIVLSTNTTLMPSDDLQGKKEPGWVDYAELTVGCVKIGFFGLVSRPWSENGVQYDGPYYKDHPQLQSDFDFAPIIAKVITQHRHEVDLLVLISHLGIYDDVRLAAEQPGIDIILGGHSHTTMTEPQRVGNTIIIHPGSHGESAARLDLDYDLGAQQITGHQFFLVANQEGDMPVNTTTNQEIQRIISPYLPAINSHFTRITTHRNPGEMARIASRAAMATMKCDAALVNPLSVVQGQKAGWLTRQDILDGFPVEREPAATPGSSSLYLLSVTGINLLHVRAALPDFAYAGPKFIDPSAIYTIALPKAQALRQLDFFGHEIGLEPAIPTTELWEMVTAFGQDQNDAHLALDDQTSPQAHKLVAGVVKDRSSEQIP